MQVTDVMPVDCCFVAEFIGFSVIGSSFDAGTGHPVGKAFGVVGAPAIAALVNRLSAEFATPDDECFIK